MYTESNVKLSCNALWQKCVLATLYRAAATHPEIKLLQFKLIPGQGINKAIPSLMADFTGELHRLISEYLQCKRRKDQSVEPTPCILVLRYHEQRIDLAKRMQPGAP
ncbi:hypothetical protein U9872_25100 [Escherichia coli]